MIITQERMAEDHVFNTFTYLLDSDMKVSISGEELGWLRDEARSRGLESFALMAENELRRRNL